MELELLFTIYYFENNICSDQYGSWPSCAAIQKSDYNLRWWYISEFEVNPMHTASDEYILGYNSEILKIDTVMS